MSPRTPEEAPFLALQQKVEAVVIGHSVESDVREPLIHAIRQLCPACLILFVFTGEMQVEALADASIDVTNGNESLVRILQRHLPTIAAD